MQPSTGVLGTHRKSTVYKLVQPGVLLPRDYLWQIEKASSDHLNYSAATLCFCVTNLVSSFPLFCSESM